jgi:hypothetical protein
MISWRKRSQACFNNSRVSLRLWTLPMWEISPRVNSPKNDDPSLWKPVNG